MTESPALLVRNLVKRFPGPDGKPFHALERISFSIDSPGALVAVAGPDGAGKTTLLRHLAGIFTPESGEVRVFGIEPDTSSRSFTETVGYMPQKTGLYEELTVWENFSLFGRLRGLGESELKQKFDELMALSGLKGFESRPAGKLSGGMKQKLGLSCALLGDPKLLILDEPTVGVDPLSRRELWRILLAMRQKSKMTVVFSTAYLDEAQAAQRAIILKSGRILADGKPDELTLGLCDRTFSLEAENPRDGQSLARVLMEKASPASKGASHLQLLDAVPRGNSVDILADRAAPPEVLLKTLSPDSPRSRVCSRKATLEDLLMDLTVRTTSRLANSSSELVKLYSPLESVQTDEVIAVKHLEKRFGPFTAVADTTFSVERGEIFGLLGPNGAGKTTTFRMLCGLLDPTAGEICVAGADMRASKAAARANVGYVAQKFSLYERLTARENLEYFGEAYGVFGRRLHERIEALAEELGLAQDLERRAAVLPLGAKRELAFACALIHRPAILFLDEATSGADLAARRAFWRRIVKLSQAGTTIVVTTHFMEEAEYCGRILIQDAGRVLAHGTPLEIRMREGAKSIDEAFRKIVLASRSREGAQA